MFGSNLNQQQPQQGGLFGGSNTGGLLGQSQVIPQMNQAQQAGIWGMQNNNGLAASNIYNNLLNFFKF